MQNNLKEAQQGEMWLMRKSWRNCLFYKREGKVEKRTGVFNHNEGLRRLVINSSPCSSREG